MLVTETIIIFYLIMVRLEWQHDLVLSISLLNALIEVTLKSYKDGGGGALECNLTGRCPFVKNLHKKPPTWLFSISRFFSPCFLPHVFYMFVPVYPSVSLYPPRDHNENKIYPDLYYAIPAIVSLIVELLRPV